MIRMIFRKNISRWTVDTMDKSRNIDNGITSIKKNRHRASKGITTPYGTYITVFSSDLI